MNHECFPNEQSNLEYQCEDSGFDPQREKLWQEIGQLYAPAGNKPSATC
jgi:hypothetical protein